MTLAYTSRLGPNIQKTFIGDQKVNGIALKTFGMVTTRFSLQNSLEKIRFLEENFLLFDISMELILGMFLLSLRNSNVLFCNKILSKRFYTTTEI